MGKNYRSLGNILACKLHFSSSNRSIRIASIILSLIFFVSVVSTVAVYDIRSPQVTLLTPQDGEYVSGEVEIIAQVQTPRAIDQVLVSFDDGANWNPMSLRSSGTFFTPATYSYTWETSILPDGTYTVMVIVLDVSGRTAGDQLEIIVDNDAPDVFLLDLFVTNDPEPTITVTGETEFIVGATDIGSGITSVAYQIDDGPWKEMEVIDNSFFFKGLIGIDDLAESNSHYLNILAIDGVGFTKSVSYKIETTGENEENSQDIGILTELYGDEWERITWFDITEMESSASFDVQFSLTTRMWDKVLLEGTFTLSDDNVDEFWLNVTNSGDFPEKVDAFEWTFTPDLPEGSILVNTSSVDEGRYIGLKLDGDAFSVGEEYQVHLEITQADIEDLFECDIVIGNEEQTTILSVREIEVESNNLLANIGYVNGGDHVVTKDVGTDSIYYEFSYELENLGEENAEGVRAWIFSAEGVKIIEQGDAYYDAIPADDSKHGDPFFALTAYLDEEIKLDLQITWTVTDDTGKSRTYTKLIDPTIADTLIVSMEGENDDDIFGRSVAMVGDVNNDGYDDILVGAPWNDAGGSSSDNIGQSYIFFGGDTMDSLPDVILTGENIGDGFGWTVGPAGDVNDDGINDVIISGRYNDAGGIDAGRAYIFYGSDSLPSTIDASNANVTITGESAGDLFGGVKKAALGDVNDDGIDDIVIAAPLNAGGGYRAGRAYIFFGRSSLLASLSATDANVTITGEATNNEFGGASTGARDVNGDGIDDVILGAYLNDAGGTDAGRAYIFYGADVWTASLSAADADVILTGSELNGRLGIDVCGLGDVNNDGYDDMIVGAPAQYEPSIMGHAYIFYGSDSLPSAIDATDANVTLTGLVTDDRFGQHLGAAGDLNHDGYDDVIISAKSSQDHGTDTGRVYVFYGGDPMDNVSDFVFIGETGGDNLGQSVSGAGDVNNDGFLDLVMSADHYQGGTGPGKVYIYTIKHGFTLIGETSDDDFSCQVGCAGDVNNDGYDDLIVSETKNDASGTNAGCVYIYYGGSSMDNTSDVVITGETDGDMFGYIISALGDVDNDGYDDVGISARYNDVGGTDAGRVYIFYGSSSLPSSIDASNADVVFTGEAAGDELLAISTAGDVNNDGYDDVIVGAPLNAAGGYRAGRAYILYGGDPMDNTTDVIITGDATNIQFGDSVSWAGDVNNDGYDDVIVGAYLHDAGGTDAGRAYIFYGGASMDNLADVTLTGEITQGHFGVSLSDAGDVNNDGYDDVIVGAPKLWTSGPERAYIFYGSDSLPSAIDATDANVTLSGEVSDIRFSERVSGAGDINNDGYDDVIVGARRNDAGGTDAGRVYIFYGGAPMDNTSDIILTGETAGDEFGYAVNEAGDLNSDGHDEIVISAMFYPGGSALGKVYIYSLEYITVNVSLVTYESSTQTIDITGVTAICSNLAHDALDDNEAIVHTYTVYNNAGIATSVTGDLEWTGSEWKSLDVDVSGLPEGTYYVKCHFEDSDATGTSETGFILLEDEGTEGNAAEYAFTGGFDGIVEDESSIVYTSSQSLNCTTINAHFSALREVSSYFKWGDFISLEVWVYRTSATNERFETKYIKSGDIYDNQETFLIDISSQPLNTWQKYTLAKDDSISAYGGLIDSDLVTHHAFYMTMNDQDPNDVVYFDGLNLKLSTSTPTNNFTITSAGYQININMPQVTYESSSQTIDITNVNAICSNSAHDLLDDTEATVHTYTVYTSGGSPTSVTGDLVWTGSGWQALDVSVSSLPDGDYYVLCYFEDSDGSGTSGNILLFIDEGTEGNAGQYSTWQGMTVTDTDPGSNTVGTQALRVRKTLTSGWHCGAYRPLPTTFLWGDFISCTVWIYRPSGQFTDPTASIKLGFLRSHSILQPGQHESINIGSQPADTWVQYTITKAMMDEHNFNGGMSDSDTVVDMFWHISSGVGNTGDYFYADGIHIKIATSTLTNEFTVVGATPTIDVSTPIVTYTDDTTQEIDITGVTATCSNPAHGELDDSEAVDHTYTVYTSGGSPTGITGDLTWTGSDWQALDVDVSSLSEGDYYVTCYFTDSDAEGTSSSSSTFTIVHIITVSTPSVTYDDVSDTIDITGVTATCSNSAHADLDDTEAVTYTYTVYTSGGSPTGITGDLSWTGSEWQALDVDVSSLSNGIYYVTCYFTDSDAEGTSSPSNTFTIGYVITVSTPTVTYTGDTTQEIDITGVTAICGNPAHGELDDSEAVDHTYTIYTEGGSPTGITGDLTWTGSEWQALDVDVSSLSEGDYYVTCYFTDSDGAGTSSPSTTFTIAHVITVSTPTVTYTGDTTQEIDITSVTASCSNSAHADLDDTEAVTYTYIVYTSGGSPTGTTGDLSWTGSEWQALDVDVSSLSEGDYYVTCYFTDSDAEDTSSPSSIFTVVHVITVNTPTVTYTGGTTQEIDITSVTAACSNSAHGTLDDIEATTHSYTIYTSGGSPTGITGDLSWTGSEWRAFDVDVSSLSEGDYYVTCYFTDSDAEGTSSPSSIFTVVHVIAVSTPSVTYDDVSDTINITDVTATCSNSAHADLDDTEAVTYTYTVYTEGGSPTGITGDLTWTGSDWQALDVDVSSLSDGNYYVTCYFTDADAEGTSSPSSIFTIGYLIMVSTPSVTYDDVTDTIDITGVTATCSNSAHGTLDDTEAVTHIYTVYTSGGSPTGITGDLSWTGSEWQALDVDVSSLSVGDYYVRCNFTDADAEGTSSPSNTFTVTHSITVSTPFVSYSSSSQTIDITGVTATCSNPAHGELDNNEATVHTYTVYTSGGSPTSVNGDLSWTGSDWQALDIDVSSLSNGDHYVRCNFADSDATGTSSPSNTFTFDDTPETIDVSTPFVVYDELNEEISIMWVVATCSNPAHGELDSTEATQHEYRVKTSGGSTVIIGDLLYLGDWFALYVDVSSLSSGTYYVRCYFKDSDGNGSSDPSNTFTIDRGGGGDGDGGDGGDGGDDDGDTGNGDGGGDSGSSLLSCILDFLTSSYSAKPGETVTLKGTISTNADGQLITITFEGTTYEVYTDNNGEFQVTVTAPDVYGVYEAKAKFAGDSTWESASAACQLLVVEEETQMSLDVQGNLVNGEQVTITITLTTENGDPVVNEQVTVYIYEWKTSSSTSSLSLQNEVEAYTADVRYWELLDTIEVTTDENGNAVTTWTVSTDNDMQIVAEFSGIVEGEGGVNIGSSTVIYGEETTGGITFLSGTSSLIFVVVGGIASAIIALLVVVMKTDLVTKRRRREELVTVMDAEKTCVSCGAPLTDDLPTFYCQECGTFIEEEALAPPEVPKDQIEIAIEETVEPQEKEEFIPSVDIIETPVDEEAIPIVEKERRCTNCRGILFDDPEAKFCPDCGANIADEIISPPEVPRKSIELLTEETVEPIEDKEQKPAIEIVDILVEEEAVSIAEKERRCASCGNILLDDPDAKFCPDCGVVIAEEVRFPPEVPKEMPEEIIEGELTQTLEKEYRCKQCGRTISNLNVKFCPDCGTLIQPK